MRSPSVVLPKPAASADGYSAKQMHDLMVPTMRRWRRAGANGNILVHDLPEFDRKFWDGTFRFTRIGTGSIGGKATGLAFIKDFLAQKFEAGRFSEYRN